MRVPSRLASQFTALVVACSMAASAASAPKPQAEDATIVGAPSTRPVRTVTDFSESLQCMDGLFLQYGKRGLRITADGLPDATGTVNVGSREMMISAIDAMSQQSRAFIYYDVDNPRQTANEPVKNDVEYRAPYYIRGAITQVDQSVMGNGKSTGVALKMLSLSQSADQDVSNLAIDMGMYNKRDDSALTGVRSQNTIRIVRRTKDRNIEGLVSFGSLNYSVKSDQAEGTHQAVRTLIDLSMIELLGKFTQVPYWRCLSMDSNDPLAKRTALGFYQSLTPDARIAAVQAALLPSQPPRKGPLDAPALQMLNQSVLRYRAENSLTPGSQIDFELYYSLLNSKLTTGGARPTASPGELFDFDVDTDGTVHEVGTKLRVRVTPNRDAYVYCYMTAGRGGGLASIMRLYPNQFSGNGFVKAGQTVQVPEDERDFVLRLKDVGPETVACIAREEGLASPPPSVTVAALTDFTIAETPADPKTVTEREMQERAAKQIRNLVDQHQGFDGKGLKSVVKVVTLSVTPK